MKKSTIMNKKNKNNWKNEKTIDKVLKNWYYFIVSKNRKENTKTIVK